MMAKLQVLLLVALVGLVQLVLGQVPPCSAGDTALFVETTKNEGSDDLCAKNSNNATAYSDCWEDKGMSAQCAECFEGYYGNLTRCADSAAVEDCAGALVAYFECTGEQIKRSEGGMLASSSVLLLTSMMMTLVFFNQ